MLLGTVQGVTHAALVDASFDRPAARVIVAGFDEPRASTNLGWTFGPWERDSRDPSEFCHVTLSADPRFGAAGASVRLDYDVDSPAPAYNGLWVKLPLVRVQEYEALSVVLKGDPARGFTHRLKLELKDGQQVATVVLDGIDGMWRRFRIPLSAFRGIHQIETATEFVVVFDDLTSTQKIGTIFLDEVAFEE